MRATSASGMGSPVSTWRAKRPSTPASQVHSSSSWLGASTKSHSVATPEWAA